MSSKAAVHHVIVNREKATQFQKDRFLTGAGAVYAVADGHFARLFNCLGRFDTIEWE
jgi:hypothetical protein